MCSVILIMKLVLHMNYYTITNTQVSRIHKAFANGSSANITFLKNHLSKMMQLGGVIRDIPIFRNVLLNLAKKETDIAGDLGKDFPDKQIDRFNIYNR